MPNTIHDGLPPLRPGRPAPPELQERRAMFAPTQIAPGLEVSSETTEIADVQCRILNPEGSVTILYLHGGGYRMGSPEAYNAYGAALAAGANARVVLPRYRLAPESPFPAGLHDAVAVYWELATMTSRPVVLAGDSAGAGLAAAVAATVGKSEMRGPAGLMLMSPWLDLRCISPYYESSSDVFFSRATAESAREDYLQGAPQDEPLASPLLADHSAFPSTLIQVGTNEALTGDALDFAESLARNNVSCTLEILADQGHTWPLIYPDSDVAHASIASCVRFVAGRADAV
ncbi:alpha/beta hydrolase fold domain-containing protein [Dietzia sp. NPDC055877]